MIVLVAACVLLLDSFVSAWASGMVPAPNAVDALGNPLCLVDTGSSEPGSPRDHSKMRDCCTIGCSMTVAIAAEPSGTSLFLRPARQATVAAAVYRPAARAPPDYDPGNPRAPPLTA